MQVDAATAQMQWDQKKVKDEVQVSLLKKTLQIQQQMIQQMMQMAQQNGVKTPPPNPNGTISLYA